jgi:hypothetical protein
MHFLILKIVTYFMGHGALKSTSAFEDVHLFENMRWYTHAGFIILPLLKFILIFKEIIHHLNCSCEKQKMLE